MSRAAVSAVPDGTATHAVLGRGSLHISHHVHGIAMLLWVLLLMMQSWLIRSGRRTGHRFLGRSSLILAPVIVGSGLWGTSTSWRARRNRWSS